MFWGEKNKINTCYLRIKKLGTDISFSLHSPLFFHSPLQRFHSRWGEVFTRFRSAAVVDRIKLATEPQNFI